MQSRRPLVRKAAGTLALLAASTLLLTACGGGGEAEPGGERAVVAMRSRSP